MLNRSGRYQNLLGQFNDSEMMTSRNLDDESIVNLTFYVMVLVLGVPGNAVIIQAYAWKKRKTSTDILIIAQAIVDFISCILAPALVVRQAFQEHITMGLCRLTSIQVDATAFASLFLTTSIGIDRYMAVCRPLRRRSTVKMSILLVAISVVAAIGFNIPFTIFFQSVQTRNGRTCRLSTSYEVSLIFTAIRMTLFIISFIATTTLYGLIYTFIREKATIHAGLVGNEIPEATGTTNDRGDSFETSLKLDSYFVNDSSNIINKTDKKSESKLSQAAPANLPSTSTHLNTASPTKPLNKHQGNMKTSDSSKHPKSREPTSASRIAEDVSTKQPKHRPVKRKNEYDFGRKITRMLLIITIFFFFTWTPNLIIHVIPIPIVHRYRDVPGMRAFIQIMLSLRLSNHVVNFFVYYYVSNGFRRDVKESFKKCKCWYLWK
ncbi:cholecystokinin receptor type A-like [Lytechinus variegatus]|uniref:cholecystokinin receptor type A-like n=1 Tax=Lytechinus variegatus TaxID=7654 RepID=UPI001BB2BDD4|nr:cholecystokinin receptor type A-like [Lytechinus variegatus]